MEKRGCNRINAVGMKIDIADKVGSSTGTIKDVSRFGVCIVGIPRKLHRKNNGVTGVISANEKQFILRLRPQWEKEDGLTMVTGVIVCDAPSAWARMIMKLEREDEELWSLMP